jgi:hypothetical protein
MVNTGDDRVDWIRPVVVDIMSSGPASCHARYLYLPLVYLIGSTFT